MSYLGIDIGTTGCKAAVFDASGRSFGTFRLEYELSSRGHGWAELDSTQVLDSCVEAIRRASLSCTHDPVTAIGISSQGEAFTPVGPDGQMLRGAMVSSDSRAAGIATDWARLFGKEKLYRVTGHTPSPMFTLFKLIWLKNNEPELYARAKSFYCFEELLHHRLGVEPAISWPLAGRTMMFDVSKHDWSDDILRAAGIGRASLARTLPSGSVVGRIPHSVCAELSLPDDVLVAAGGHDQPCGALGAGVTREGRAVYGIGTVECITPAFGEPRFSEDLFHSNLCTYDHTVRGMHTTVAYSLTGGNLLKWFVDEFGSIEANEATNSGTSAYELLLSRLPAAPTRLMVLPYFTPSGTPHFETNVAGAILGLRLTSTRAEILKSLLEGVTLEMRLNLEILKRSQVAVDELVAIGGGARSRELLQLKADVLGVPISLAEVSEAGCMGAAMLAASADTGEGVAGIAERWVRVVKTIRPDPGNAAEYDDKFGVYLELYPALKELNSRSNTG